MDFDYNNEHLDEIASNKQQLILDKIRTGLSIKEASDELGINYNTARRNMGDLRIKANRHISDLHDASMNKVVPDGYHVKGASSAVRNADGLITWIKTDIDKAKIELNLNKAIEKLTAKLPTRPKIKTPAKQLDSDLLNQYTFTDYHIGMLAWHKEGGDNWNVNIARDVLKRAFSDMIERSPKAKTCVINQLGDFLHFDSMVPETPTSGHPLDADTRPEKMVEVAIDCMDYLICEALNHHEKVKVVISQGNHDLYSSIWLRKTFSYMYRKNKRVEFIDSSVPFYALTWGDSLLGYHHGHKVKFASLPNLFMDQFRSLYGLTNKTYIHMGHYHHQEIKELGTTTVEMHRTLAARDAHASYGGYHSQRASDVITYHKKHGEVCRATVRPFLFGDC